MTAVERLIARIGSVGAPLCIGIDPHPDRLPAGLPAGVEGVEAFARGLIETVADDVAAVKLNVAFFEAFGAHGWAVLERVRRDIPADVLCIIDAKRGDIGSTAERYAAGIFGHLDADAVTLSPYLGEDAIEPFLAHAGRIAYVLARTSNPSAARLQELSIDGEPLHVHVARWVADRWPDGRVGIVVGATAPDELIRLRSIVPVLPFLVPGVGAQGGDLATSVQMAAGERVPGLVSVSRAIAEASRGTDWREAARAAARDYRGRMADAVLHSTTSAAHAADSGGS